MGFRINTNIAAMNAQRNSTINAHGLDKSLASLSSGLKINRAADDAAGVALSSKLSAQSQGLGQAIRNSNDAIGLIQTADGALEEYGNIMKRVRVLAVQSANDTQDATSRGYLQQEMRAILAEADEIATSTTFNGINLLDGTGGDGAGKFTFHIGAYNSDTQSVTIPDTQVANIGANTAVAGWVIDTQVNAETTIGSADQQIKAIDDVRATLGSAQNKLESNIRNISVTQVNITSAESNIRDVDFAAESANFSRHNIIAQSGSYAMSQANATQQNVTRLFQ